LARLEDLDVDVVLLHLESSADERTLFALESAEISPRPAFVILTDNAENVSVDALRSAHAVLPLAAKAEEIIGAIHASMAGLMVFHRDLFNSLLLPLVGSEQPLDPSDRMGLGIKRSPLGSEFPTTLSNFTSAQFWPNLAPQIVPRP